MKFQTPVLLFISLPSVTAFSPVPSFQSCGACTTFTNRQEQRKHYRSTGALNSSEKGDSSSDAQQQQQQWDVSELGLTVDDLNAPLPSELLRGMETSGYQSTSRLDDDDEACFWTETNDSVSATLAIPGLRGQPAACLAVLFSTTTISITAFGRVVWSTILRGTIDPESAVFDTAEGASMVPVVNLSFRKVDTSRRWDGMILQVGEDSLL